MASVDEIVQELKTKRDEIELQIHLASKEVQQDYHELEEKWEHIRSKVGLEQTAEGVGSALELLGEELKRGYERIRKAL